LAGSVSTVRHPAAAAMQDGRNAATAPPTVAVRPFEEIDASPSSTDLARAISADPMTDLSKVSGIPVIGGTGKSASGAQTQQPRYVLTGTVQHDADLLRLNVLLTESATGHPVWSERFDRRVADLFSVQDELVKNILKSLPAQISDAETLRIAKRSTRNLRAWE